MRRNIRRIPAYYQADFALHEAGRLGQKNGKGYYRYETGNRARIDDPEAIEILAARAQELQIQPREHSEAGDRRALPVIRCSTKAFRILGEGIALRASDIDVVWTAGYGFPRYRGGPMFYADTIGLPTLLDGMRKYRDMFGPMHWEPAPLLVELVEERHEHRGVGSITVEEGAAMNVDDLIAIDVHTHAEVSCRHEPDEDWKPFEEASAKYFKAGKRPTIAETIAYYRERKIGLVMFTVDSEFEIGAKRIPNEEVADAARENSDMMIAFASIDPHKGKMGVREARRCSRTA